jgi:hypothetical protein
VTAVESVFPIDAERKPTYMALVVYRKSNVPYVKKIALALTADRSKRMGIGRVFAKNAIILFLSIPIWSFTSEPNPTFHIG